MKNILIFYGSYGGGHLSAAKAINAYIEQNYSDCKVEMIDCIEYINKTVNKLSTAAYSQMAKKAPWAWKKVYYSAEKGVLSKVSNASNHLMSHKLKKLIDKFQPNIIISTHPFSSQMCTILKKKKQLPCKVATIMTDFHIHNQWLINSDYMDYYFVANSQMKEEMLQLGIDDYKIFVTGIPVSERFLEDFCKDDICKEFKISTDKKNILFFAGGEFGLGKDKTFEIFKVLVENFSTFQIIAIAGRNQKMKELFQNFISDKKTNVTILEYTNKVPELMSISDAVITKPGGLTSTEGLVSNLPMIIINPIPGQEEQNAKFLENTGVAVWLKKDDNIKEILDSVLNSQEKLKQMQKNALALAKPYSTKNICDILLK